MEKLQPPSVSRILMDPDLANKSTTDLCFMAQLKDCCAKEELEANRKRIDQLQVEKHHLKEESAAHQFQICTLQYTDCKLHLLPPTPRPSNSSSVLPEKPRKLNTFPCCHRLPPIAQAIPMAQASAGTNSLA
ncbi:hypothetical protein DPEC_G00176410 [Dallia pectoralis]|uniref:Uncharacterized protein n=1 Tax=Dallia pectoralis TaxID=75939 RepID=A0ACC2GEV0_DALPE|nr:hypothetical protein DPEC_G00176410 [Dallia pectoralis]